MVDDMRKKKRHDAPEMILGNCWCCRLSTKEDTTMRYLEAERMPIEILLEKTRRALSPNKRKRRIRRK